MALKPETNQILLKLTEYLEKHPGIRFAQALANLDVNECYVVTGGERPVLRDIYYDEDADILLRMLKAEENLLNSPKTNEP